MKSQTVSEVLRELLDNICEINEILETDLSHFVHNRKDEIQNSIQKKQSLITRMQLHFNQLEKLLHTAAEKQQGMIVTISDLIAMQDSKEAAVSNQYRKEIQSALKNGSEQINCNSQVIVANLNYFHEIYRRLSLVAEQCVATYEKPTKQTV